VDTVDGQTAGTVLVIKFQLIATGVGTDLIGRLVQAGRAKPAEADQGKHRKLHTDTSVKKYMTINHYNVRL
jgi:hypothetical protein